MALGTGGVHRLVNAVDSLVGAGPIRDRLESAALTLLALKVDDFVQGEQWDLFEQIRTDVTKLSGALEVGHAPTTIRAMDEDQAVKTGREHRPPDVVRATRRAKRLVRDRAALSAPPVTLRNCS